MGRRYQKGDRRGEQHVTERKSRKKAAILLLLLALIISIGASVAFFSDFVTGVLTGRAGTLDLRSTTVQATRYWTNTEGPQSDGPHTSIANLNPGDIVRIRFDVYNVGNKSAWLRDRVTLAIGRNHANVQPATSGMFELYPSTVTPAQIRAGTAGTPLATATNTGFTFESTHQIINGAVGSPGREVETGTNVVEGNVAREYFLYFRPEAGNEYQQISLSFEIRTQAMQYRNNPTPNWSDITTTEFTLGENPPPISGSGASLTATQVGTSSSHPQHNRISLQILFSTDLQAWEFMDSVLTPDMIENYMELEEFMLFTIYDIHGYNYSSFDDLFQSSSNPFNNIRDVFELTFGGTLENWIMQIFAVADIGESITTEIIIDGPRWNRNI